MKRTYKTHDLVYRYLYPNPSPSDPHDFHSHLVKNLITEVRIETHRFYGGLETIEAKYPGLNYAHPPHRGRLSQFQHHRKLFEAFDALGLTPYEIAELCKWEGTLWARQRYERDEGIRVLDTTGDEIPNWQYKPKNAAGHKRNATSRVDLEKKTYKSRPSEYDWWETSSWNPYFSSYYGGGSWYGYSNSPSTTSWPRVTYDPFWDCLSISSSTSSSSSSSTPYRLSSAASSSSSTSTSSLRKRFPQNHRSSFREHPGFYSNPSDTEPVIFNPAEKKDNKPKPQENPLSYVVAANGTMSPVSLVAEQDDSTREEPSEYFLSDSETPSTVRNVTMELGSSKSLFSNISSASSESSASGMGTPLTSVSSPEPMMCDKPMSIFAEKSEKNACQSVESTAIILGSFPIKQEE